MTSDDKPAGRGAWHYIKALPGVVLAAVFVVLSAWDVVSDLLVLPTLLDQGFSTAFFISLLILVTCHFLFLIRFSVGLKDSPSGSTSSIPCGGCIACFFVCFMMFGALALPVVEGLINFVTKVREVATGGSTPPPQQHSASKPASHAPPPSAKSRPVKRAVGSVRHAVRHLAGQINVMPATASPGTDKHAEAALAPDESGAATFVWQGELAVAATSSNITELTLIGAGDGDNDGDSRYLRKAAKPRSFFANYKKTRNWVANKIRTTELQTLEGLFEAVPQLMVQLAVLSLQPREAAESNTLLQLSTLSSMLTVLTKVTIIPAVPADLLLWLGAILLVGSDAFGLFFVAASLFWLPDEGGMATFEPFVASVPLTLPSALMLWQIVFLIVIVIVGTAVVFLTSGWTLRDNPFARCFRSVKRNTCSEWVTMIVCLPCILGAAAMMLGFVLLCIGVVLAFVFTYGSSTLYMFIAGVHLTPLALWVTMQDREHRGQQAHSILFNAYTLRALNRAGCGWCACHASRRARLCCRRSCLGCGPPSARNKRPLMRPPTVFTATLPSGEPVPVDEGAEATMARQSELWEARNLEWEGVCHPLALSPGAWLQAVAKLAGGSGGGEGLALAAAKPVDVSVALPAFAIEARLMATHDATPSPNEFSVAEPEPSTLAGVMQPRTLKKGLQVWLLIFGPTALYAVLVYPVLLLVLAPQGMASLRITQVVAMLAMWVCLGLGLGLVLVRHVWLGRGFRKAMRGAGVGAVGFAAGWGLSLVGSAELSGDWSRVLDVVSRCRQAAATLAAHGLASSEALVSKTAFAKQGGGGGGSVVSSTAGAGAGAGAGASGGSTAAVQSAAVQPLPCADMPDKGGGDVGAGTNEVEAEAGAETEVEAEAEAEGEAEVEAEGEVGHEATRATAAEASRGPPVLETLL